MQTTINCGDIVQGKPLVFNCYDSNGVLLLRRGQVIGSEKQIAALVARGLFRSDTAPEAARAEPAREQKKTPFSLMENCKDQVRGLFAKIKACCGADLPEHVSFHELAASYREALREMGRNRPADFPEQIIKVCQGIQVLCKIDEDAAIAAVHLDAVCRYGTIHAIHTALLSELVASRLGVPPRERLSILAAALTANISIINLQESLHAQDREPTEAEKELIRIHPQLSIEMLLELGVKDDLWIQTILQHHEKPDGNGYPCGLKGEAIAVSAQILSLADIYGAMVKPRGNREGVPGKDVLRKIFMNRGAMAEDKLVQIFIKTLGIYPPGSFVKLENGETAIVTRRGTSPAAPKVKSVRDPLGMPLAYANSRDTAQRVFAICIGIPRDKLMAINFNALWDYSLAG